MPVDVQDPPTKEEVATRQSGLAKWMTGLHDALPNPSVGAGNDAEPKPQPDAPAQPASSPAAPVADHKPTEVAAPAPETPASAKPEDESKWPRSAKEWKNFTEKQKARVAEFEKQLAEREAKIKDLEAKTNQAITPEVQKEIDGLKKENDEFSRQLRLVAVTTHPRFKQYFDSKTNATLAQLKNCVPADRIESVTKLIQEPDSERRDNSINELLEEMTPLQRARMQGVLSGLSAIQAEKEAEISRANQDYEQMVAQAKAQKEQQQAGFHKSLEDTIKSMQDAKAGRPEYQMREGETEWNASVQKRIEAGKKLITGNLPADVMFRAAFDAAAYPDVLAGYKAALGEVDKLKKQIAAMSAANPKLETQTRSQPNGSEPEPVMPKDSRPMDYTKNWVKKFGAAMQGNG